MKSRGFIHKLMLLAAVATLSSCASYQPTQVNNVCSIFRGEPDWYEAAVEANEKWGTPVWVMMAIIHQESRFVEDAKPPRDWFLFIPIPRRSSAYGYAQAQDPVWDEYLKITSRWSADRDEFDDAIDFVGWYTHKTQRALGISKWDAYNQYLAYHEGRGGYKRGTWKSKPWLQKVATKVKNQAASYNSQLKSCKAELDDKIDGWLFF